MTTPAAALNPSARRPRSAGGHKLATGHPAAHARPGARPRAADDEPPCPSGGGVTASAAALNPSARRPRSDGGYKLATGQLPPPTLASASARAPLTASLSVSAATA